MNICLTYFLSKLYGMFDFSSYENIVKYLPYCLCGSEGEAGASSVRKYVRQIFTKNYKNNSDAKYPITVEEFCELATHVQT